MSADEAPEPRQPRPLAVLPTGERWKNRPRDKAAQRNLYPRLLHDLFFPKLSQSRPNCLRESVVDSSSNIPSRLLPRLKFPNLSPHLTAPLSRLGRPHALQR